jgi:carboxypeptidase PM20D1
MKDITEFFTSESDYPDLDSDGAAERLSAAIRCVTVNDGTDYAGFEALQNLMKESYPAVLRAGSFELIGRSVLITIPGSNRELLPALFMSHQDVVPVVAGTENDWTYPAFSGAIADGYIWGRGTLDIKNQVFGIFEAAEYLLSRGARFERTVYFAFGEDEETYNFGAKAISDTLKSRGVRLEFVLDEGGGKIQSGAAFGAPEISFSQIDLMEKGYADLELSAKSAGGHSSHPFGGTSLGRLSCAIAHIVEHPFPAELSPVVKGTFSALAPYITEEPLKTLAADLDKNASALADYCLGVPELFPLVTTTIAPTIIRGSSAACNVMPQNMEAVVNFRIAEGHTADEVMEKCQRVVADPEVSLRFLQGNDPSATARTDGFGYRTLKAALIRYFQDVVVIPCMTAGATDAHHYEQICDTCLRCSPFMGNEDEVARGVHGTDEKLSLRAYAQGIRVLIRIMEALTEQKA